MQETKTAADDASIIAAVGRRSTNGISTARSTSA